MYAHSNPPAHGKPPMSTGAKMAAGFAGCAGVCLLLVIMLAACGAVLSETGSGSSAAGASPSVRESDASSSGATEDAGEGQGDEPKEEPKPEKPDEPKDTPKPEPEPEALTAGIYMVGDDIDPGTYRTDGPGADSLMGMCYWARLSGTSGELDDIIANGNEQGPSVVTVESSDAALELSGDCEWTLAE